MRKFAIECPSCSCGLSADKNAAQYTCPLCGTVIDVQKQTAKEAIFFRDVQALDLFPAGHYTLSTQNLLVLQELYKLPSNADTFFHSEVYFINKTVQMGIKWGTDSKVRFFDPATGLHLEIGACGQFNLKVSGYALKPTMLILNVHDFEKEYNNSTYT